MHAKSVMWSVSLAAVGVLAGSWLIGDANLAEARTRLERVVNPRG